MTDKEIDNLLEADSQTMISDLRPKLKMQLAKEEMQKKENIKENKGGE